MPKKPPEDIMVGVLGTGEMDVDQATTLLEDYMNAEIQGEESVRLIFPMVTGEFSDTMDELVNMATENSIAYELITNAEDKARRRFTEIAATARKTYMAPAPFLQLETILVEAPRAVLFVLWDSERDDEMQAVVGKFVDAGIDTREWTDGLTRLGLEDGDGEPSEEPEATDYEPVDVESTEVAVDGAQEPETTPLYSRTDLKEMSMSDLKEVAKSLGLPPRKARETMINEIMDAQGGEVVPEEAPESPVEPEEPSEVLPPAADLHEPVGGSQVALEAFQHRFLDEFQEMVMSLGNTILSRLSDLLDDKLADLGKTIEGVAFNLAPEPQAEPEPEPVQEEPQPRRLVRRK